MKKHYYNTNDTFEKVAKRHIRHEIKLAKQELKANKNEDDIFNEDISYEEYKLWQTNH